MHALCARINKALGTGPIVLASIITQSGSAPRTSGARMLVAPNGSIEGSIGGGRYEAESIALALNLLQEFTLKPKLQKIPACAIFFALNSASDMDMICGGNVLVLLELLLPTVQNLEFFAHAAEAEGKATGFTLASRLDFKETKFFGQGSQEFAEEAHTSQKNSAQESIKTKFAKGSTEREIFLHGSHCAEHSKDFALALQEASTASAPFIQSILGTLWLFEPFLATERILILGAGHVSLALARIAEHTGFSSTVIDDRSEFANAPRFPHSHLICPPSLKEAELGGIFAQLAPSQRDAIVIVTRGHAFDKDALAAALRTGAGYIGMIGSSPKRKQIYAALLGEGFSEADLARVFSPIGLAIGAQTPEEIAVSILAELIAWRYGLLKHSGVNS